MLTKNRRKNLTSEEIENMRNDKNQGSTYSEISEKYNISKNSINAYVVSWNKGFGNPTKLMEHYAEKNGFKSLSNYKKFLQYNKGDNIFPEMLEHNNENGYRQRKFEWNLEYDACRENLEKILIEEDNSGKLAKRIEFWKTVKQSLSGISKGFEVVFGKWVYGKNFVELGNQFGVTKQRANQVYLKSIIHLESHKSSFSDFRG